MGNKENIRTQPASTLIHCGRKGKEGKTESRFQDSITVAYKNKVQFQLD